MGNIITAFPLCVKENFQKFLNFFRKIIHIFCKLLQNVRALTTVFENPQLRSAVILAKSLFHRSYL